MLAAKFAAEVDVNADGIDVALGTLQDKYDKLAASLREQYKAMFETGVFPADADLVAAMTGYDPTIPPLNFGTGFQDNFEAGKQDYGDRDLEDAPAGHGGWIEEAV